MSQSGRLRVTQGVLPPVVPIQFTTNSGVAVPALGNLNVLGAVVAADTQPFRFIGSGSTVTGQVQISQAIAATDATKIGLSNFNSAQFTVDANGFVSTSGTGIGNTITGDSGGAVSPTAGNWNILGQQAGTLPVMDTIGTPGTSTLSIENRTWFTSLVVDPSATVGLRGTFQTITAAIAAAVSGQTIFIRPGTYTENFTLKSGVDLIGFDPRNLTIIAGTITIDSGSSSIANLQLRPLSTSCILHSSSNSYQLYVRNCDFHAQGAVEAILLSGAGANVSTYNCVNTSQTYFNVANGSFLTNYSFVDQAVAANFCTSNGLVAFYNSKIDQAITSASGTFQAYNTTFSVGVLTIGSVSSGNIISNCQFLNYLSNTAISISAGATLTLTNSVISSNNTNAIDGAGTLQYANLSFTGSSSKIASTIQVPEVRSNDAVKIVSPGAYPYTTIPQDAVILVDTSSARTIVPLASPTTGQVHRIKDNVGSAAANNITITPSGKNIDGAASYVINNAYGAVDIIYNGTEWSKF